MAVFPLRVLMQLLFKKHGFAVTISKCYINMNWIPFYSITDWRIYLDGIRDRIVDYGETLEVTENVQVT
jgi:hypothetical protein